MIHQSPIAPGISFYQAKLAERPAYGSLPGDTSADVAVIGGGFTGLQAACHLARAGRDVVLIDGARFGDGASGRNGGQLGTGQRSAADELEASIGYERSLKLFQLAERAKAHLHAFAAENGIDTEFRPGQISASHKKSYLPAYQAYARAVAERYDYPHVRYLDHDEISAKIGSKRFFGGTIDTGTGHINPLKYLVGLARTAAGAGARLHEETRARSISTGGGKVTIGTDRGTITAGKALVACNGYIDGLEPVTAAHVMPLRSFIGATAPLPADTPVIPGGESVDDSRFVVRYFRKSIDNRLLFGGREAYTADTPGDISIHIRRQISEIYPDLADVEITQAWGGSVGITMPRLPFVREVMPGVTAIGGYSGHGVMLSNYCGKLYADLVCGGSDDLEALRALDIKPFPGGRRFRKPLLFLALTWFSLRDRL